MLRYVYRHRRILLWGVTLCVLLGLFFNHKLRLRKRRYADFHCYYTMAKRVAPRAQFYLVNDPESPEYRYAPVFAVWLSPLALFSEDTADSVWFIVNVGLLFLSWRLMRELNAGSTGDKKSRVIFTAIFIFIAFRQFLRNLNSGQANILMMSLLLYSLYALLRDRPISAGAAIAAASMMKLTPAIFIPYLFLKRQYRAAAAALVWIAFFLFLFPALALGIEANFNYLKRFIYFLTQSSIFHYTTILDYKNQSLLSTVYRYFTNCKAYLPYAPQVMPFQRLGLGLPAQQVIVVLAYLALYIPLLFIRPKKTDFRLDYAQLLVCITLFNANAWAHHFILLLPGYFLLLESLLVKRSQDAFIWLVVVISLLLDFFTSAGIVSKPLANKFLFYSPLTLGAVLVYLGLFKLKVSQKLV